jgi:hypothetical protein
MCAQGFGGGSLRERELGRPGLRWEANIKMTQEIGRKGDLNWIDQVRDKDGSVSIKCGE